MRNVRLGLCAYATDTGLGIQTRSIYKHLQPSKTMLVDLRQLNHMPVHESWYDYDLRTHGFPTDDEVDRFLDGLDVVMCCETPLNYRLFDRARQLGIKTVLQLNPEFLDYFNQPALPRPDVLALPSRWMENQIRRVAGTAVVEHIPVPIDLDELPRRIITQARTFFHVAGRPAVRDRNGTLGFIQAARLAHTYEPDAKFVLYCQQPTPEIRRALHGSPVQLRGAVEQPADMYRDGDVLVLPRRYGGLCLPAQEAIGCGIPVMMTDVSPNNDLLPPDWLVPVLPRVESFVTRGPIEVYSVNVTALAQRMLDLYRHPDAVQRMHEQAKELAQSMSWKPLLPRYEEVLTSQKVAA